MIFRGRTPNSKKRAKSGHSTGHQPRSFTDPELHHLSPLGNVGASDGPESVGAGQVRDDETEVCQGVREVAQPRPSVVTEETEAGVVPPLLPRPAHVVPAARQDDALAGQVGHAGRVARPVLQALG